MSGFDADDPAPATSVSLSPNVPFREGFEIHGVRVGLGASEREILERLVALLPPGLPRCDPEAVDWHVALLPVGESAWQYKSPGRSSPMFTDLSLVVAMLDTELRRYVAGHAPERFFVHAGAVSYGDRAILIPGSSFSGKSMLVAALVRAGAEYYSDEYAVLDEHGLVHPYARPLSIRRDRPEPPDRPSAESLGGTVGVEPVPVGLIAATAYRPQASFRPEPRSAAQGMLALMAHMTGSRERPKEALEAARHAAATALVLEGERGEADAAAEVLLHRLAATVANAAGSGR